MKPLSKVRLKRKSGSFFSKIIGAFGSFEDTDKISVYVDRIYHESKNKKVKKAVRRSLKKKFRLREISYET